MNLLKRSKLTPRIISTSIIAMKKKNPFPAHNMNLRGKSTDAAIPGVNVQHVAPPVVDPRHIQSDTEVVPDEHLPLAANTTVNGEGGTVLDQHSDIGDDVTETESQDVQNAGYAAVVKGVLVTLTLTENEPSIGDMISVNRKDARKPGQRGMGGDGVVRGTATGVMVAGPKRRDTTRKSVFVYNVSHRVTDETLKEHLTDNEICDAEVALKSHQFSRWKSFKVTVSAQLYDKMCNPAIWGEGVCIRDYREFRGGYL